MTTDNLNQKDTLDEIKKEGITPEEVKSLQEILSNTTETKKLEQEIEFELSTYLKNNQDETNKLITAIETSLGTAEEQSKEAYTKLLVEIKKFLPKENDEKKEAVNNTPDILAIERTAEFATEAMETKSEQFDKIFTAAGDTKNLGSLKKLAINYSDKNKKIEDITNITAITASADDDNFVEGVKYLNITSKKQKNNEIFSFGNADKLTNNYIKRINQTDKLTGTNINTKREQYNTDLAGASSEKRTAIFNAFVDKIGKSGNDGKDLKIFLDNIKSTDKLFSNNKTENTKKLTTAINKSNLSAADKLTYLTKITNFTNPKFTENLSSTDFLGEGLDKMKEKLGPVKGILMKILNMINSNPMLKSMFGNFFDKDNGVEDRLTEGYELDASQKTIVGDVLKKFGDSKNIKSIEDAMKPDNKNKLKSALTTIEFGDISPDFKSYMMNATGKDTKNKYKNTDDIITDYMEMIGEKDSPLRTKYEDAMKQLKDDGVKNPDLVQIMTASILNFQEDGEGMKYLWTRNNVESGKPEENKEDVKETPEQELAKEFKTMLDKPDPTDRELITFYDKMFTDGKALNGTLENMGITKKKEAKGILTKMDNQLGKYIEAIKSEKLEETYNMDILNKLKTHTTILIEENSTEIEKDIALKIIANLGEEKIVKEFPEDVETTFDQLESGSNKDSEHEAALTALNTNFDEVLLHFKKGLLTGALTQEEQTKYINLLAKTDDKNNKFNFEETIRDGTYDKNKSSIVITDNTINIELKNEAGIKKKTISITKGGAESTFPTFSPA